MFRHKPCKRSVSESIDIIRKDIESQLIAKALKDEEFKNALLKDAKATIEQLFQIEPPQALSVHVVEETDTQVYLVLPHNPYEGIEESAIQNELRMSLEEVASWVLEQQKSFLLEDQQKNAQLIAKAWRDPSFRKLLLADPKLLIEHELGEQLNEKVTFEVLEETSDRIFIVLPYLADNLLYEQEIDTHFINMPIVVGSHSHGSDPGKTHGPECALTSFSDAQCVDRPITNFDDAYCRERPTLAVGYFSCNLLTAGVKCIR